MKHNTVATARKQKPARPKSQRQATQDSPRILGPIRVPENPGPFEGIEIWSHGTEKLRESYVESVKSLMTSFYREAGIADLMFMYDVLMGWEQNAGVITRRCVIADVVLYKLGGSLETFAREEVRFRQTQDQEDQPK
jgi:hypothetical protein